MKICIASFDPSLSNWGCVRAYYDTETDSVEIQEFRLIETRKSTVKSQRINSDDLERARVLTAGIEPFDRFAHIAIAELPVGSQSSRGQTNYGVCLGVLAGLKTPLIQVTPNEIKKLVGGKLSVSKEEVIAWATHKHPEAPWLKRKLKGEEVLVAKNEHLADAVAALYVGIQKPEFQQTISILQTIPICR